jgi:argininosuccinate synthase
VVLRRCATALDAFNAQIAERMTGEVRIALVRGRAVVTGSRSPFALYAKSSRRTAMPIRSSTMPPPGFIEIVGLPIAAGADKAVAKPRSGRRSSRAKARWRAPT